jgi:hypothetical protein
LKNKRSTYKTKLKKKKTHPFWHNWASCFICVLPITDMKVLQDHPMNIPTKFGCNWASGITERRRLNTDNKLFDSYGSLFSFGYFRSTTKYKRIINLFLQFHSISIYTRKSIKQTYINISITLYRFGGTLMYFTKDMVCGLCNCGMVIKLKMKK